MIGWHLVRLIEEAALELTGATLESIRFAPTTGRLLFTYGSHRGKRLVVIGVHGTRPTLYWVDRKADLPLAASFEPSERFNRLRNGRLLQVTLPGADRLACFEFEKAREDQNVRYRLWVGWLGGAGNIWLVDTETGRILEALRKTESATLGAEFKPPAPPDLIDWRDFTFPEFLRQREGDPSQTLTAFLRQRFWGIDPALARALGEANSPTDQTTGEPGSVRSRWREFARIVGHLRTATTRDSPLVVVKSADGKTSILPRGLSPEAGYHLHSLAHALASTDGDVARSDAREEWFAQARAELQARGKQLHRRLRTIEKTIADGARADDVKHEGDLLAANRHLLRRGTSDITLTDWKSGEPRRISLDPALSPQENIELLYQRARKLARGAETASAQKSEIEAELRTTEESLATIDTAPDTTDDLPDTLLSSVTSGSAAPGKRAVPARRVPYREFTIGKYTILIGKSRKDNDELTLHAARPHDLFLHADRVGGSHVILRRPEKGRDFPPEVIGVAAQAAAFFSKAKHSGLVPVIYTEVRYVSKPRKAPAGLVRVSNEKSLMVVPAPPPGYHDGQTSE